jgi:hypothetical protein
MVLGEVLMDAEQALPLALGSDKKMLIKFWKVTAWKTE